MYEKKRINVNDLEQKGYVPKKAGYVEDTAKMKATNNDVMCQKYDINSFVDLVKCAQKHITKYSQIEYTTNRITR